MKQTMVKWIGYILVIGLVILSIGFGWYLIAVSRTINFTEPVVVEIAEGSGTEGAVSALYQAKVIRSRWAFTAQAFLTGQRTAIKAGKYTFIGEVNIPTALAVITQAKSLQPEVQVTLVEGWTNEQIAQTLSKAGLGTETSLSSALDFLPADAPEQVSETLKNSTTTQGFLFPDTYRFFQASTPDDIMLKLLNNFNSKFTDKMRADTIAAGHTEYDAVILASIVQKEAKTPEDMKKVAGVFWKRIAAGMPLQSDVTVEYITRKIGVRPTLADLEVESAYNTYRNVGLPPTPICNPGLDALEAVVYPTESDAWYFLATPTGEVKYSATYDQHLQYKAQYYP